MHALLAAAALHDDMFVDWFYCVDLFGLTKSELKVLQQISLHFLFSTLVEEVVTQ